MGMLGYAPGSATSERLKHFRVQMMPLQRCPAVRKPATIPNMTADVSILRFTDKQRIGELHALVTGAFRDLPIDPPSGVLKETIGDFLKRLETETALVAESDAVLVGGVFCASQPDSLYVGRLAVRGDVRRLGVASRLLEAAKDEARRLGKGKVTLSTRISLKSNIALFSKHGFAVVAETCHPGFLHPTSYDMELRLTG
jgi:ribosomal protein S18 acetylase RimI-like enzyme